jgi:hypothetical protein
MRAIRSKRLNGVSFKWVTGAASTHVLMCARAAPSEASDCSFARTGRCVLPFHNPA